MNWSDLETVLNAAMRLAVPLLFAAIGEWIAERAGTLNLSIEGMLLGGAFASMIGAELTGSTVGGLIVGALAGLLIASLHAQFCYRLSANNFVVGITLTILVVALTGFLLTEITMQPAQTGILTIPVLENIPLIGQALFSQRWPAFLVWPLIPAAWWLIYRSRWGLEARAAGENPKSADASGIPVNLRRRQALMIAGALAGLGGAHFAISEVGRFSQEMTGGRGFIVLAAVIFGGWRLKGTILGCLLFGLADSLRLALPALGYTLNPQLLISSPYVLALAVMLVFAGRARRPAALAHPFRRGAP
jgi:general nucleoside transport system permease protein